MSSHDMMSWRGVNTGWSGMVAWLGSEHPTLLQGRECVWRASMLNCPACIAIVWLRGFPRPRSCSLAGGGGSVVESGSGLSSLHAEGTVAARLLVLWKSRDERRDGYWMYMVEVDRHGCTRVCSWYSR